MIKPLHKQFISPKSQFHQNGQITDFTACDFWQWAFSDLQLNNIRGVLAEFLVAKALDIPLNVRNTWDDFDLETQDGTKIEVKSGGFLQSWQQKGISRITFGGLRGQRWNHDDCCYVGEAEYRADIFVFAVQTAQKHEDFKPLDINQWEFYVIPQNVIAERNTKTIALSVVKKLAQAVSFSGLKKEIRKDQT